MKKRMMAGIVFFLLVYPAFAQQQPIKRDLGSFSELVVGDRIIVRLVKSDKESALIQTQGISESAVKTELANNLLEISIYGEPFTKKKVMITLNYVHLSSITVTGGADVTTTSLFKDDLYVDLKSGGMLYLDADIKQLNGKLTEGAILSAEGYCTNMNLTIATTATLSAYEFECETATIKTSSGGKAKINVEKELNAEASSKGYVSYKGNPAKINRNAVSGGMIESYKP